jgi:hypothetical protein
MECIKRGKKNRKKHNKETMGRNKKCKKEKYNDVKKTLVTAGKKFLNNLNRPKN